MKRIKFMLEFGCIPIWVLDGDDLISVGLPEDLSHNKELVELVKEISYEYDDLFVNNSIEFSYKGFTDKKEEYKFNKKVSQAINLLKTVSENKYLIEVDESCFN